VLGGLELGRLLLGFVAQVLDVLVPEEGVVVEVHLGVQRQHVAGIAVVASRPEVRVGSRLHELRRDAHASPRPQDRPSDHRIDMKIARIETFILGTGSSKDLLFCRVETEDGLYGWGEAYVTHGKEKVVADCIEAMAPHVIGRSAFNIRHTGQIMFDDFAIRRISLELMAAWSAIEIASWDIIGKRAGLPVYNLIGGASRERVRVYANGWSRGTTIEEGIERGLKVKAMGFTAAKFDPFPGPWRSFVDRRDEDFAIDYVRAMRQALGPDFELLIEAHRRFAPAHAIRIGHRLAEFGIDWCSVARL